MIPPTNVEAVDGQMFAPGESLVLGRVTEVNSNGDTVDFGEPRSMNLIVAGYTKITAVHVMVGDSAEGRIPLRGDGTFVWHLKPGEYSLIGITHFTGPNYITEYWRAREVFTVSPSDSSIYIGNAIVMEKMPEVRDDYDSAVLMMKAKVPSLFIQPTKHLMRQGTQGIPPSIRGR